MADTTSTYHWTDQAPAMLRDAGRCSRGGDDETTQDRRWLWRLESFIAVSGTNEGHHQLGRDLRQYLNESCPHHWHAFEADEDIPGHRQCLYCNDVEWGDGVSSCGDQDLDG